MPIIAFEKVSIAYGLHPLLNEADFQLFAKEKVCLVGRNGAGKSTLLKLMAQQVEPDSGEVRVRNGVKVGVLPQELPEANDTTIYDYVATGLGGQGKLIREYHDLANHQGTLDSEAWMNKLLALQEKIDASGAWELQQRVESTLSKLKLPMDAELASLSGGWRRRVSLAKLMVQEPDVMLLDEPTNHMDLKTILWMEDVLKNFNGTLLFISHDRQFIDEIASRIIELDRGKISSWSGNFSAYREGKEQALEVEAKHNDLFDKKLAEEEVWIRQGIKARRTRNEGRVRALKKLRDEHKARVEYQRTANISVEESNKSGKLVAELKNVSYQYDDKAIVKDFSANIMRGDRIGILGPNGCGKSTLIKLILGELQPQSGDIRQGTKLEVAYFEQTRSQLDLEKSIQENVGDGKDLLPIGSGSRHVLSYLNDFLFSAERARTPVKALSGGETNRVLLAKIFAKPSNLLILDEPTNDLDIETVELLEDLISQYQGTLFLVSHDRSFINNVVTSTIVFEGEGKLTQYVGGYDDWLRQTQSSSSSQKTSTLQLHSNVDKSSSNNGAKQAAKKQQKLSYKEQRRLDELPAELERLEAELEAIQQKTAAEDFYKQDHQMVQQILSEVESAQEKLDDAFLEWEALEEKQLQLQQNK